MVNRNQRGITLIALVITIIVLLILAGVTINILLGQDGIINRTQQAKEQHEYAAAKEIIDLKLAEIYTDAVSKNEEYTMSKITTGMTEDSTITIDEKYFSATGSLKTGVSDSIVNLKGIVVSANQYSRFKFLVSGVNGSIQVIGYTTETIPNTWTTGDLPTGFIAIASSDKTGGDEPTTPPAPVNSNVTLAEAQSNDMFSKTINSKYMDSTYTGTKNGKPNNVVTIPAGYKITTDATKIEEGIVITDASSNGNEWVWIPVNEEMADTIEATELGGLGKSEVTTTLKSISELLSGKTRTNIGAKSGYREPDIVTVYDKNDDATTTDKDEAQYIKQAGFNTVAEYATELKTSYAEMIKSVQDYGGFYVGRYEITGTLESPTEKPGDPITGGSATTEHPGQQNANWYMLYNACKKLKNNAENDVAKASNIETRMIWGCTWDEICKFIANKGYTDSNSGTFGNYTKSKLQTGNASYKACNIFDLAGNCYERTQEANSTYYRAIRGGYCNDDASDYPVSSRRVPNSSSNDCTSSRAILYVK